MVSKNCITYSKHLRLSLEVTDDFISEIDKLVKENINELKISIVCSDDIEIAFETISDLIEYKNPKSREIKGVLISNTFKSNSDTIFDLSIYDFSYPLTLTGNIKIYIKSDESTVSSLRHRLMEIIQAHKTWYSFIYKLNLVFMSFTLSYFVAVGLSFYLPWNNYTLIMCGAFIFITIYEFLKGFRNKFFPGVVFLIGYGKSRYKNLEKVQIGIIIASVISVASGLIFFIAQFFL